VGLRRVEDTMIKQESLPPVTISTGDYDRLAFLASFGLK
jgi:regulator of nucleoside diphosphate kinase